MNRIFVFLAALAIVAIIGGSYVLGQNSSKPQEVKAAAATTGQTQQTAAPNNPRPAADDGGTQPTVVPTAVPAATPQPTATVVPAPQVKITQQCLDWNTFVAQTQNLTDPYKLIDWLDQRPEKVDHPQGGYTLSPGVYVMWTGLYVQDTTLGGTTTPYRVDGKTGVWIVNTTRNLVVPTPGGTICISGFTTAAAPAPQLASCIDAARVVSIINSNKKVDPNRIYIQLDELVDQNVNARLRASGPAVQPGKNSRTLFWVRNGNIQGSVLPIDSTEDKTLYLVTRDGDVNITFAHSGVMLCGDINPQRDFPWWGKN